MFSRPRQTRLILVAALVTVIALLALVTKLPALRPFEAVDPRLKIYATRVLRSPQDHFYGGSQLIGQMTDFLRNRLRLTILKPSNDIGQAVTTSMDWKFSHPALAFIMQFKWASQENIGTIRGEWMDTSGRVVSWSTGTFDKASSPKNGVWILHCNRPGRYRLRLMREVIGAAQTNSECLATTRFIEVVPSNGKALQE